MKIGVFGYKGRLGSTLVKMGCVPIDCDLTDIDTVRDTLSVVLPDVIVNCAATTDVDGVQDKLKDNPALLKLHLGAINNLRKTYWGNIIQLSTDFIYSGKWPNSGPYRESDRVTTPVNDYGFLKWGSEQALLAHDIPGDIVIRTTGLYGGHSGADDFVKWTLDKLKMGLPFLVARNFAGNLTYIPHLAEAIIKVAGNKSAPKIINIANDGVMSRFKAAQKIAKLAGYDPELAKSEVHKFIAPRPFAGGLRTEFAQALGLPIYTFEQGIEAYLEREDFRVH